MITVPQKVEEIVRDSPYIEQALFEGVLNLSSFARKIRPRIEEELYKSVTEASVVMALKRLSNQIDTKIYSDNYANYFGDITIRSNLLEYTYANSDTLISRLKDLMSQTPDSVFLTWTRGVYETTIILSQGMKKVIERFFEDEVLRFSSSNLSSITIKLPEKNIEEPGVYYVALKKLAWEGINISEAISTFTELTIILSSDDVDRAFSALKS